MHDDALKTLWQAQGIEPAPPLSDANLLAEMKNRMSCLNRTLFWRDCRENIAAVIVMIFFGFYFFIFPILLARVGCVIEILSALLVMVYPIWRKRRLAKPRSDASLMQSLEAELRNVEVEITLLRSVHWWYILPGTVGGVVFLAGFNISRTFIIPLVLGGIAFDVFVYWLNQRAVKQNLLPLKRELASLLQSAKTGEPLDQTHFASLRRTALSVMGVGQVRPAEFKVAFWQLAIFGVPGIVGIWFFGMVGLTEGQVWRIFNWQYLIWIVPFFLGGLLYSWLLQKTTQRAVGISTLGVHLWNGQNLILWDEIEEVRPSRFLHIRNLWLIKESGEKTIMHWTPLERHSELKAAVESFAPANHPIRKYLSLLR